MWAGQQQQQVGSSFTYPAAQYGVTPQVQPAATNTASDGPKDWAAKAAEWAQQRHLIEQQQQMQQQQMQYNQYNQYYQQYQYPPGPAYQAAHPPAQHMLPPPPPHHMIQPPHSYPPQPSSQIPHPPPSHIPYNQPPYRPPPPLHPAVPTPAVAAVSAGMPQFQQPNAPYMQQAHPYNVPQQSPLRFPPPHVSQMPRFSQSSHVVPSSHVPPLRFPSPHSSLSRMPQPSLHASPSNVPRPLLDNPLSHAPHPNSSHVPPHVPHSHVNTNVSQFPSAQTQKASPSKESLTEQSLSLKPQTSASFNSPLHGQAFSLFKPPSQEDDHSQTALLSKDAIDRTDTTTTDASDNVAIDAESSTDRLTDEGGMPLVKSETVGEKKLCIPGLDLAEKSSSDTSRGQDVPASSSTEQSAVNSSNSANDMLQSSLGKIVTQLKALKNVKKTESTVEEERDSAYDDTQKKMAALLENESDSDEESNKATQSNPLAPAAVPTAPHNIEARDFEGFGDKPFYSSRSIGSSPGNWGSRVPAAPTRPPMKNPFPMRQAPAEYEYPQRPHPRFYHDDDYPDRFPEERVWRDSRPYSPEEQYPRTDSSYEQRQSYDYREADPPASAPPYAKDNRWVDRKHSEGYRYSVLDNMQSVDYGHGKRALEDDRDPYYKDTIEEVFHHHQQQQQQQLPSVFPQGIDYTLTQLQQKGLPKWLKQELETMERKKASEMERSKNESIRGVGSSRSAKWREDELADEIDDTPSDQYRKRSHSPHGSDYSEGQSRALQRKRFKDDLSGSQDIAKMDQVRVMMTDILLAVTNSEMNSIANEIINIETGLSISDNKTAYLADINPLGLEVYGSDDSESDDAATTKSNIKLTLEIDQKHSTQSVTGSVIRSYNPLPLEREEQKHKQSSKWDSDLVGETQASNKHHSSHSSKSRSRDRSVERSPSKPVVIDKKRSLSKALRDKSPNNSGNKDKDIHHFAKKKDRKRSASPSHHRKSSPKHSRKHSRHHHRRHSHHGHHKSSSSSSHGGEKRPV